jgi:hypothetical protein
MIKEFYFLLKPPLKYIFVCFGLTFLLNGLIQYKIPFLQNASFFITVLFCMASVVYSTKYSTDTLHIILSTSKNTLEFWKKFIFISIVISSAIVTFFLSSVSCFSGTVNELLPPTVKIHFYFLSVVIYLVTVSFGYENQFLVKSSMSIKAITLDTIINFIVFFIVTLLSYYMITASLTVLTVLMLFKLFSSKLVKNTVGRRFAQPFIIISIFIPLSLYLMTAFVDPRNRDVSWVPGLGASKQVTFDDLQSVKTAADWRNWAHNVQHVFGPDEAVEALAKLDAVCEQQVSDSVSGVICLGDDYQVEEKKTFLPTLDSTSIKALMESNVELAKLAGIFAARKLVFDMPIEIKNKLEKLASVPGRLSVAAQNTLALKDENYAELKVFILKK